MIVGTVCDGERGRTGHPGDRAVGDGAGELEHLRAERGDEHRARAVVGATSMRDVRARSSRRRTSALPSVSSGISTDEVLAHVPQRLVEREAEHVLDHDLVREADAEREAPAARGLHGERLLRHRERVAAVGGHDAGRELDARHLAADDREHAHRVEAEDLGE